MLSTTENLQIQPIIDPRNIPPNRSREGQLYYNTDGKGLQFYNGTLWSSVGSPGTVTSVGLSMPTAFSVANSPITGSGTFSVTGAGTSSQVVLGDGTLGPLSTGTVTSVSGTGVVSGLTLSGTVTSSGSLTLGGSLVLTSLQITNGLGYTPYDDANPDGFTSFAEPGIFSGGGTPTLAAGVTAADIRNLIGAGTSSTSGTVTSVSGTGTVSGLTLSGTVTSSGDLTLGGTLTLTSSDITTGLGYTPYNATNPAGYTTNTGTTTASNTQTFTNKSGNISQWTNDSGYTTNTGDVIGTGTTNYLSKFTGSSAIGDSIVFDNGTNVGIGTSSSIAKLHVKGSGATFATDALLVQNSAATELFKVRNDGATQFNGQVIINSTGDTGLDPVTQTSSPLLAQVKFGGNANLYMSEPDEWLAITINGKNYVIPAYIGFIGAYEHRVIADGGIFENGDCLNLALN